MTLRKKIIASAAGTLALATLAACGTQATQVSRNLAVESENFEITRRLAVINTITDQPQLELVGNFSIEVDSDDGQLEVTVKDPDGGFKKHFVGLGPTVTYIVEDVTGTDVSPYRDQISYLPERLIPIEFKDGSAAPGWEGDGR